MINIQKKASLEQSKTKILNSAKERDNPSSLETKMHSSPKNAAELWSGKPFPGEGGEQFLENVRRAKKSLQKGESEEALRILDRALTGESRGSEYSVEKRESSLEAHAREVSAAGYPPLRNDVGKINAKAITACFHRPGVHALGVEQIGDLFQLYARDLDREEFVQLATLFLRKTMPAQGVVAGFIRWLGFAGKPLNKYRDRQILMNRIRQSARLRDEGQRLTKIEVDSIIEAALEHYPHTKAEHIEDLAEPLFGDWGLPKGWQKAVENRLLTLRAEAVVRELPTLQQSPHAQELIAWLQQNGYTGAKRGFKLGPRLVLRDRGIYGQGRDDWADVAYGVKHCRGTSVRNIKEEILRHYEDVGEGNAQLWRLSR